MSRRGLTTAKLRLQSLEDRALPSFGFGSAVGVGGTGADYGNAIVLDAAGSTYVSGFYNGTVDFDPNHTGSASILTATDPTNGDGFVAKYAANGTFQWATDLGSGVALELAVQGSNVYVPYYNAASSGGYVSRLDAGTGAVSWTTTLTTTGHADAVAISPSGILYADGFTGGSTGQAVVDRLDPATGNVLWSQTSSGGGAIRLAVDGSGNAYAAGTYSGTATFGGKSLTSYAGASDTFVWKLSSSGGTIWAGSMGSSGGTTPSGVTSDGSGNVYLTGYWYAGTNNFNPGTGKAVSLTNHGSADAFIVKLTPGSNGALQLGWAKDIGGSGLDIGNAVAVDGSGNVYTTGGFTGTVNFNPNSGKAQNLSGGGVFLSKLDLNGNYVASVSMAGTADGNGAGIARGIALDGSGNVYLAGFFSGTADFDPTGGVYNLTSNGSADVFVAKLTQPVTPSAGGPPSGGSNSGPAAAVAVDLSAADLPTADAGIDWLTVAAKSKGRLYAAWLTDGQ